MFYVTLGREVKFPSSFTWFLDLPSAFPLWSNSLSGSWWVSRGRGDKWGWRKGGGLRIWKCPHSPPSWMIFETFLHLLCTLTSLHKSFVPHTSVVSQFSDESYSCPCSAWYQTITPLTWRQNGINAAFFFFLIKTKQVKPFCLFVCLLACYQNTSVLMLILHQSV